MINAKDCVPAGESFQARAGEMFLPTHEYLAGMDCPFVNASLVNLKDISASVVGSIVSGRVAAGSGEFVVEDVQAETNKLSRTKLYILFLTLPLISLLLTFRRKLSTGLLRWQVEFLISGLSLVS